MPEIDGRLESDAFVPLVEGALDLAHVGEQLRVLAGVALALGMFQCLHEHLLAPEVGGAVGDDLIGEPPREPGPPLMS